MGNLYVGVNGSADKASKLYVGVNGVARRVKKLYVGVNDTARLVFGKELEETSWEEISAIAQSGAAGSFWSVGDTKSVVLNGTVGTVSLDTTLYVYIIGINHEGVDGVTFQGFKTEQENGKSVALVDSNYNLSSTDGSLWFNMSHWGNGNYGGWKGCDLRYDILGSTNVAPSGYGSAPTSSRIGYDATSTATSHPVANTLMSALPTALRAVMKLMTIYTLNGNNASINSVTSSKDYLPLLAEFEVFGKNSHASSLEPRYQAQYTYYADGNSKYKYKYPYTGSGSDWWMRSPYYNTTGSFLEINTAAASFTGLTDISKGLAPIFLV